MQGSDFSTKNFVPKHLRAFPLYSHLIEMMDFIMNENVVQFKTAEELNEVIATFFGTSIDEVQKEAVLIYYKIFVEPFLGTSEAIERLFNILNLEAKVVTWYNNKVPLPPYKFNLEFSETPENLDVKTLLDLIYLVKNERSHLASIKNPDNPDAAVWDWSDWDRDCWDNPGGINIDGINWNLVKKLNLYFNLALTLDFETHTSHNFWIYEMFQKNGAVNNDLIANDGTVYNPFSLTITNITPLGIEVMFDTQLIGDIDETLLVSSLPYNRISFANEIKSIYESNLISHLNCYTQFKKNSLKQIIGARNKTQNEFYYDCLPNTQIYLDNQDSLKGYDSFVIKNTELTSMDISKLMPVNFNLFLTFKLENISTQYKTIFRTINNSLKIEMSNAKLKITNVSGSVKEYVISNINNKWCYLSLTKNKIILNGLSYPHALSLKIDTSISFGDVNFSGLKITNIILTNDELDNSTLSKYIINYFGG